MPISTNLNIPPYYDDFDIAKQYHRILFKPSYALQARELTQLQTILQDQLEQFGNNIFQEGSIVKGCNFTELNNLEYVKVVDKQYFTPLSYVGEILEDGSEISYHLVGSVTGLKASIIAASTGFETKPPDLNTFYINYLNTTTNSGGSITYKVFQAGEALRIDKITVLGASTTTEEGVNYINVTSQSNSTGSSFGLQAASGVVFQKGNFLYAAEQTVIVSKYSNSPDNVSVGYKIDESIVTARRDPSLYDNAVGSPNKNAPGADRLKLTPTLVVIPTPIADADTTFFTLARYSNGAAIQVRDVSQYNVIGQEMAKRTYEQSGDYITSKFGLSAVDKNNSLYAAIGAGTAYVKGFRIENKNTTYLPIDQVSTSSAGTQINQPISFTYGGYVDVTGINGTLVLGATANNTVDLYDGITQTGTAIVDNITPTKMFLYGIKMSANNKFTTVDTVVGSSGSISIGTVIKDKSNSTLVFDTGVSSLKSMNNISLPVRATKNITGISSDTIVVNAAAGEDFDVDNTDIVLVDASNTNLTIDSISVDSTKTILTINITPGQSPTSTAVLYYNKRYQNAEPHNKTIKNVYLKTTFASGTTQYNLDFPDVLEIISITDSASKDVTDSFRLNTNQKDTYYDHSYIELKPGTPVPANGQITINLKVFKVNYTTGAGFFTVNSYPIGSGANQIPYNKIPVYTNTSGRSFALRNCVDFRPYVDLTSGADYEASTAGSAPVIAASLELTPVFTANSCLIPALNTSANADYEYYFKRIDSIVVNSFGNFSIIKGEESEMPKPPAISDGLLIGQVSIPGYPALSPATAATDKSPQYAVKITNSGTNTYTMQDIDNINKTVEDLRYYVVLSQLEASTQNLNILDSNGLSRFKNGIVVDPFNDTSIADTSNIEYNAAMDFTEKSLIPAVKTFPISLKPKLSSSVNASLFPTSLNPTIATLQRTENVSIMSQPYATNYRNCVSNFYNYSGVGRISPSYDASYDTVTDPVNINIDIATPVNNLAQAIQQFYPLTSTSTKVVSSNVKSSTSGRTTTTDVTTNTQTTKKSLQISNTTQEQYVGDFVTNIDFKPYMRTNNIKIYVSGLRPDTQHYVFFDSVDVNAHVVPGTITDKVEDIQSNGEFGDIVTTDSKGVLRAIFTIPENTFFVGSRNIEVVDIPNYGDISSASTSYGFITYNAYNYSVNNKALTISTKTPQSSVITNTTTNTVVQRSVTTSSDKDPPRPSGRIDPLAQTFFIKSAMTKGANCLFASKIDLYFKRKSAVNGINVMLREVLNGYPTYNIIPFSLVHLTPDQVNVPGDGDADASVVTTVTFDAPIRLNAETEYAVVIQPDACDPSYLIYTSKVGGKDFISGSPITQDWGDGVLFTSTNNRAWQSYQDEDIKFNLYRHDFTASTGSVTLTNNDNEFLSITNSIGKFKNGEMVYSKLGTSTGSISITKGSTIITGTSLNTYYAINDYIVVEYLGKRNIFRVVEVSSTTITADRPALFTATTAAYPAVVGKICYYDYKNPISLILEGSSATSGKVFAASSTITGLDSGAIATVSSINNVELSYFQSFINKTIDNNSTISMTGTFTDPADTNNSYTMNVPFDDKTLFNANGMVLFSKSNDPNRNKPFELMINMGNNIVSTTTPFVDIEDATLLAYQYIISDDSSKTSKYISKIVELAENFDAEDFVFYATAYKPANTDVKVYLKVHNVSDPLAFEANEWIEMLPKTTIYSSTNNLNDFREIEYYIPNTAKTVGGVITYTNTSGTYESFRKFAVKIEMIVNQVDGRYPIGSVPRLLDYRGIAVT